MVLRNTTPRNNNNKKILLGAIHPDFLMAPFSYVTRFLTINYFGIIEPQCLIYEF